MSSPYDETATHQPGGLKEPTPSGSSLSEAPLPSHVGDFEIRGVLGRGGMGVVYDAWSPRLKKAVALKVVREQGKKRKQGQPQDNARFRQEAQAAARLRHDHIVRLLEFHRTPDGQAYLAMERVEGESLSRRLHREGRLPIAEVLQIGIEVASALDYAHENRVLHRDVKPSNLLQRKDKTTLLTDFGLAKVLDLDTESLTKTGDLLGTPAYMSPEQARSERERFGPGIDIYSLGATLFHLLTGHPPFEASTLTALLLQIVSTSPPSPRDERVEVPRDVEAVILRCLAKQPERRFASAGTLEAELRACLQRLQAPPSRWGTTGFFPPQLGEGELDEDPRRGLKLAASCVLLALCVAMVWDLVRAPTSPQAGKGAPLQASPTPKGPKAALPERLEPPGWLAWRVAQAKSLPEGSVPWAASVADAFLEAKTRNVPVVFVILDGLRLEPPPPLREPRLTSVLKEGAVPVGVAPGSHAQEGEACPIYQTITCRAHAEALSALEALGVVVPQAPFPPKDAIFGPAGAIFAPISSDTLRPDVCRNSIGRLQHNLGSRRIGYSTLMDLGGRLSESVEILAFDAVLEAITEARQCLDERAPPVITTLAATRLRELARRGLELISLAGVAKRSDLEERLRTALGRDPAEAAR